MSSIKDSFLDLERHRQRLDEQIEKLTIALEEWQQWKQEYETLRDDVKASSQQASQSDLARVRQDYDGELIAEKELVEVFGRNDSKKPDQIIGLLTNRLDYVARNISTLSKQLRATQDKFAAATVVSNPGAADEEGLPITEIVETLDDEDNVVSYNLRRPGDNQAQLLEALEKVGITDLGSKEVINEPPETRDTTNAPEISASPREISAKKRSVSSAEDTKPAETPVPVRQSGRASKVEDIMRQAKEQEDIISDPVIPADDSPEDADLREQMIRYNRETMLYEMAPIVAELNLEEGSSGDDMESFDDDEEDEEDEDEDQWGMSLSGVVNDRYRQQMLELKERLSSHVFGGDQPNQESNGDDGVGRITIKREEPVVSPANEKTARGPEPEPEPEPAADAKKSVRFAPSLDIAAPPPTKTPGEVDPLSDVMERKPGLAKPSLTASSKKRTSRFKRDRITESASTPPAPAIIPDLADRTRYAPSGPEGQTLATSVLEREPSAEATEPDEFDADFLQQQVAGEYYKMRNKFIHRQGGFLKENESAVQPLDEEEGGPKRVSKFKAARLSQP